MAVALKQLEEKKGRGCFNIKSALCDLSEAETNCEYIEKEVLAQAEKLVSFMLRITVIQIGEILTCLPLCRIKNPQKPSYMYVVQVQFLDLDTQRRKASVAPH